MNIFEKIFGNLKLVFKFLNRDNSPSNKSSISNSSGNIVQQAARDFNIGVGHSEDVSDLERKILHELYREYRTSSKLMGWNITKAFRQLGVLDGSYVGVLNDSRYIKLEGDAIFLTNNGIRYMDTRFSQNRPRVDLVQNFSVSGSSRGNEIVFKVKNDGINPAIDIEFKLSSDESETSVMNIIHSISPGQEIPHEIRYRYTDTDFFRKELKNPCIVFCYKDPDGNEFISGRFISQTPRADGNFNIHSRLGHYFSS